MEEKLKVGDYARWEWPAAGTWAEGGIVELDQWGGVTLAISACADAEWRGCYPKPEVGAVHRFGFGSGSDGITLTPLQRPTFDGLTSAECYARFLGNWGALESGLPLPWKNLTPAQIAEGKRCDIAVMRPTHEAALRAAMRASSPTSVRDDDEVVLDRCRDA